MSAIASKKIWIGDSGQGTRLIAQGLDLRQDDPALWVLDHPESVWRLHQEDVAAGADLVTTCSFGASRERLARLGRENDQAPILRESARLARAAAGPDRTVVGCLGPADDQIDNAHRAKTLVDSGADVIILETYGYVGAVRSLEAWGQDCKAPLWISLFQWPEPIEANANRLASLGAAAIGANCRIDLHALEELAKRLRAGSGLPILLKPSGGLPGEPPIPPETFAEFVPAWLRAGVQTIGGCCGTTPLHIAAIRAVADECRL